MSHLMTKPTKWSVHPAKTQISLGICPVWSESLLCTQWVVKDLSFLHADSKDWSDCVDAQADLSLRWNHMPFCWFCHEAAQINFFFHKMIFLERYHTFNTNKAFITTNSRSKAETSTYGILQGQTVLDRNILRTWPKWPKCPSTVWKALATC